MEGDAATARDRCEQAFSASAAVADAAYLFPFAVTGTRAYLAVGDPNGARDWVERVDGALTARGIPGTLPAVRHARGLLAIADGRTALARDELRAAGAAWTARGRAWEGSWASIDLARALDRAHLPGPAGEALAEARAAAQRLGSPVLAAAADPARPRRGRDPGDPWAPLTAREFEVARLVAEGSTNAAIGAHLGVSPRTISAHVEHILAKLGVGRRAEIAAWVAARPVLHSRPHGKDREE
jgi:DNA-binding CsgD family transcriptional regulator